MNPQCKRIKVSSQASKVLGGDKKPSPEGEGWVRGNQNKENADLTPLIPTFSLREKEPMPRY